MIKLWSGLPIRLIGVYIMAHSKEKLTITRVPVKPIPITSGLEIYTRYCAAYHPFILRANGVAGRPEPNVRPAHASFLDISIREAGRAAICRNATFASDCTIIP